MAMFSWVCLFVHGKQGKMNVVVEEEKLHLSEMISLISFTSKRENAVKEFVTPWFLLHNEWERETDQLRGCSPVGQTDFMMHLQLGSPWDAWEFLQDFDGNAHSLLHVEDFVDLMVAAIITAPGGNFIMWQAEVETLQAFGNVVMILYNLWLSIQLLSVQFSARILPELSLIMQNCSILVIMWLNVFGV